MAPAAGRWTSGGGPSRARPRISPADSGRSRARSVFRAGRRRRLPLPRGPLPRQGRHGRAVRGGGPRAARARRAQDDPVHDRPGRALGDAVQARGAPGPAGDPSQRLPDLRRVPPQAAGRPPGPRSRPADVMFLAMELLHGETLADRLRREGRLSTADALVLARQMASALTAAHRAGVVHRDFKTAERHAGRAGGARRGACAPSSPTSAWPSAARTTTAPDLSLDLDDAGEISGTPAYMAPEQVEGGPATPATDQYALGVVLYEMVTGTRPFVADTAIKIAVKRLQEPPPPPRTHVPDLDPRWEATILRCLARQPSDRFASVAEAIAALEGRPRRRPPRPRTEAGGARARSRRSCWRRPAPPISGPRAPLRPRHRGHHLPRRVALRQHGEGPGEGVPRGRHQRKPHPPPVAAPGREGHREQLLHAVQGQGRRPAGGGARPGRARRRDGQGPAARRRTSRSAWS